MSGIGMVLDVAKRALLAQSYGLQVTGHNIANVNTEGYSRQRAVFSPEDPFLFGGVWLGRGVDLETVQRVSDQFVENQVAGEKSTLSYSTEMESYMKVLEGLFSESSGSSVSDMLSQFWNMWQDVGTNPSGDAERIVLYEHSVMLAEQLNTLDADLTQLQTDLTNSVTAGIGEINQITSEIAELNGQLAGAEINSVANDLRDKRNTLVARLSEYLDVNTFDQSNGSLTVVTARGAVLVNLNENYDLTINGSAAEWESSSGVKIDITNYLSTGKLGGWLDMRDETIAKYKLDFDSFSEELAWTVNQQHSQGAGLTGFSSLTGTNAVSDNTEELGTVDSGLDYYDKIVDGTFNFWVYDSTGAVVGGVPTVITVDADAAGTTLTSLVADITAVANITATVTAAEKLQITADSGFTFAFSNDASNVLAALGVNTFFTGATAGGIVVNTAIASNKDLIAAAQVDNTPTSSTYGLFATGNNTNALAISDLQTTSTSIAQWTVDRLNGNTQGTVSTTLEEYFHSMVGSIGIESASVSRSRTFSESMLNSLEAIRESISGVSLDEEMTNLIKFQRAYTAAAKLISVSDEMLAALIATK